METLDAVKSAVEKSDEAALGKQDEAVHVAVQWAQEKIDHFLTEIEADSKDPKLLNISYIISRRARVEVFSSKKTSLGDFVSDTIRKFSNNQIMDGLTGVITGAVGKALGASSGSAKTDRVYEITFDELGGLNRLDAFIFSYSFISAGLTDFTKAVIGICIVRSAATMVDDNAYRVILTSTAKFEDAQRAKINECLQQVAEGQKSTLDESGERIAVEPGVLAKRAKLSEVIGDGIAHSEGNEKLTAAKEVDALPASADARETAEEDARRLVKAQTTASPEPSSTTPVFQPAL